MSEKNMQIKSGWLQMNKTERKEIETVLEHCLIDLSYYASGTFNKALDGSFDSKGAEKAKKGIEHIRWILQSYCG